MNWAAKILYIDFIKKTSSLVSIKKLVIHPLIRQFWTKLRKKSLNLLHFSVIKESYEHGVTSLSFY